MGLSRCAAHALVLASALVPLLAGSCASVVGSGADLAGSGGRDTGLAGDAATSGDGGHGDGGGACQLGTADHCGMCDNSCPPGSDTASTLRTCSSATVFGTCDFKCRGEYYDVDGKDANGCEAVDEPIQDTAQTAVPLIVGDTTNTLNLAEKIYGDKRAHESAPSSRVNGREDWYSVTVTGAGSSQSTMVACLGITSFPPDNVFQICISDIGKTTFDPGSCQTVIGGADSVCVLPPARSDAGGPYYIRVLKVEGVTSLNKYALFMQH